MQAITKGAQLLTLQLLCGCNCRCFMKHCHLINKFLQHFSQHDMHPYVLLFMLAGCQHLHQAASSHTVQSTEHLV